MGINPWAFLLLLLAVGFFIVAYKGTQDNVISALKGKPYGSSGLDTLQPSGEYLSGIYTTAVPGPNAVSYLTNPPSIPLSGTQFTTVP